MKCFVLIISGYLLFMFPSLSFSAYLIKLKTGQEIITKGFWEQNGEIKFFRYNGVVGVKKGLVENIKEVPFDFETTTKKKKTKVSNEKPQPSNSKEIVPKKNPEATEPNSKGSGGPVADKEMPPVNLPDLEPYRESYLELKAQYEQAKKAYWKARRSKNTADKEKALYEMGSAERWLKDLEEKVRQKNNGVLPDWWQ